MTKSERRNKIRELNSMAREIQDEISELLRQEEAEGNDEFWE
jgi:hypothetical protein